MARLKVEFINATTNEVVERFHDNDDFVSKRELALRYAARLPVGTVIRLVDTPNKLQYRYQVGRHAGHPSITAIKKVGIAGTEPAPRVRLVVAVIGDGYLYGASDSDAAHHRGYWMQLNLDDEPYSLFHTKPMPLELAKKLENQGTSAQDFDDGYTAMRAAHPYMPKRAFYTNEGRESEDSPRASRHARRDPHYASPGTISHALYRTAVSIKKAITGKR